MKIKTIDNVAHFYFFETEEECKRWWEIWKSEDHFRWERWPERGGAGGGVGWFSIGIDERPFHGETDEYFYLKPVSETIDEIRKEMQELTRQEIELMELMRDN